MLSIHMAKDIHLAALLAVEPAGKVNDHFQLLLDGMKPIELTIAAIDVLPHPARKDMEFSAHLHPGINAYFNPTLRWILVSILRLK